MPVNATNMILMADALLRNEAQAVATRPATACECVRCEALQAEVRHRTALCVVSIVLAKAMATIWALSTSA